MIAWPLFPYSILLFIFSLCNPHTVSVVCVQRDVNSVTSLIDKVRVNFEREGFTIGPLELPDEIRGSITNFVCNSGASLWCVKCAKRAVTL